MGARVTILFIDARGARVPFDPEAVRARRALETLEAVTLSRAGGPVEIQVDLALLPGDREGREGCLADAMDSLARALDEVGRTSPATYAAAAGRLRRITFRLDPQARRNRAKISDDGEAVEARSSRPDQALLQSVDYTHLLRERAEALARARYAKREPAEVPRAERPAYLDTLLRVPPGGGPDDPDGTAGAERVFRLLGLHEVARADGDDALTRDARHALVSAGGDLFRDLAHRRPEVLDGASATSPLRRAERAYSAFLVAGLHDLDEGEALAAVRAGFARVPRADARAPSAQYVLPSFDRLQVALTLLADWRTRRVDPPPALHFVVCPEARVRYGDRVTVSQSSYCGGELYRLARAEPVALDALARDALRADDVAFTRLLFSRVARGGGRLSAPLHTAKALFGTRLFPVAIDALASALDGEGDDGLVSDARVLARDLPAARGDVAYLVARALTLRVSTPVFARFGELFGAPLELGDFGRFMAYGESAVQSAVATVPAFASGARGAPRARVFLTKLDAYLDRAAERRAERGPDTTLSDLREGLCADGDDAARAEIGKAIAKRRKAHPDEGLTDAFERPCPRPATPRALRRPRPSPR
ncbi:MAG: hypothetical protein IPF92_22445 [Myxococcales bacterium]|nr:hypothetical protein [Myxococcales bacterium]